ncbi:ATP-grasp fold amidoligase family protein, partial [Acinetobacter soli]
GHTSKDVFIITNNEIISVENRNRITHSDLKLRIEKSIFKRWMIEEYVTSELLGGIPYDVKVFCFYGVVKLILVIDRNNSKLRYDWLDENFSRVNTGRFNDSLFNSEFKDQKAIDYAKIISLEIPTPFLRIDFLYTGENLYLGEITPRPGHFHEFNYEYD